MNDFTDLDEVLSLSSANLASQASQSNLASYGMDGRYDSLVKVSLRWTISSMFESYSRCGFHWKIISWNKNLISKFDFHDTKLFAFFKNLWKIFFCLETCFSFHQIKISFRNRKFISKKKVYFKIIYFFFRYIKK